MELICPYCGSHDCHKDYDLTWKDARFAKYSVASCQACHVGFVLPLPTVDELKSLYDSIEYHDEDRGSGNLWEFDQAQLDAKIQSEQIFAAKYRDHLPANGHVLDVGAGWGTLLKSFSVKGYQTTGIELSETASEFAREKLQLNVFNLPIENLDQLPDEKYDLVTMRHVLEHFYDPATVLTDLRSRMKPGGKIIIEVPDYGSFDLKRYGTAWPAFGPYHLWYFSRKSLQRLLNDTGFEIIHFHLFFSERFFAGPSVFNRMVRKIFRTLGAKRFVSGRSIGLIARKIQSP